MLTKRELEVLDLLSKGYNNVEIADILCISIHTAKAHVAAIIYKLKVKNRTHAAYIAGQALTLRKIDKIDLRGVTIECDELVELLNKSLSK
ncbi:MAG: helix-turn-helix transcriptional regulator [Muribaculaceae bacterium]|nr:helix-turn-helix transcriptional regulator [Muribaculaceae bacterium]